MVTSSIKKKKNPFKGYTIGDWIIISIFIILCASMIYPVLNIIALSMSTKEAIFANKSMIIPTEFDFRAYGILLKSTTIWKSILLTIGVAILSTILMLLLTLVTGYVLSHDDLPGKKYMNIFLIITMLFGGGIVPFYMVLKALGFLNSFWVHIVPGLLGAYNIFLMRNFIDNIPKSVQEAARLDGANVFQNLVYIITPLSIPILATLGVFGLIAKWNDWFTAYMYLPGRPDLQLIQNIVRNFVVTTNTTVGQQDMVPTDNAQGYSNTILVLCTIPIVCIYPLCLKYFTQGLYFGSVK